MDASGARGVAIGEKGDFLFRGSGVEQFQVFSCPYELDHDAARFERFVLSVNYTNWFLDKTVWQGFFNFEPY